MRRSACCIASAGLASAIAVASSFGAAQTPSSIRSFYGFDQLSNTGAGQTIAVIVAYTDPSTASDLAYFDAHFGLTPAPSLTIVNQTGGSTLPSQEPTGSHDWEYESALDIQYAHAIAPQANILVVAAESPTYANLFTAVRYAKSVPGVSAISMSFAGQDYGGYSFFDEAFTQPTNHAGVSFVAASGDRGIQANYPATSPHVLAVGGTTITATGETAWSKSGGGVSPSFTRPAYQDAVHDGPDRTVPDVAYDADPQTGFLIYNQLNGSTGTGDANFIQIGGTSAGAPQWAGLIALANEGRAANGLESLTGDQTLTMLYALYNTPYYALAFNDITTGSNPIPATTGYDLVTGLGTPKAEFLVPYLAGSILIPEPAMLSLVGFAVLLRRTRRVAA
ncbi:MAG: pcp 2 [Phycisphaerales bacterium]|nr:pcp 2 [Phycisphaerales bacterium]